MILKQLLNGRQHSDFIVIRDNLTVSGLKLLKLFIENNLNRGHNVIFLMYEYPEYEFNTSFTSYKNFVAYNCFEDPWNWIGDNECKKLKDVSASLKSLNEINIVIIDSLIYLLFQDNLHSICSSFKEILYSNSDTNRNQLISLLHMNVFEEESTEVKQIECLAKSIVTLEHDFKTKSNTVVVEHRKSSGKIIKEEYNCSLDLSQGGDFTFDILKKKLENLPPKETNLIDITTFKLTLEDHEKESRSRVILPYVKKEESGSRIFYVPDANDDWDDEDPDDDLEI